LELYLEQEEKIFELAFRQLGWVFIEFEVVFRKFELVVKKFGVDLD
jgi:hypothetical protein